MWKSVLAGSLALALTGSGLAIAQPRPDPRPPQAGPPAPQSAPAQPSAPAEKPPDAPPRSGLETRLDERMASLRSRLALTPEQEKSWGAFEQAYREFAKQRVESWRALREGPRGDNPIEAMQERADFMIRRASAMRQLADAALPLFRGLSAEQQRRFLDAAPPFGPGPGWGGDRGPMDGRMGGGHRGHGYGYGYGPYGYGPGPRRWDDDRDWRGRDDDGRDWRDYGPRPYRGWPERGWSEREDWRDGHGRGPGPSWSWRERDRDDPDCRGYGFDRRGMGPPDRDCRDRNWRDRDPREGDWRDRDRYERRGGSGLSPDEERF